MTEAQKKWAKNATLITPADRPAKLEHNPVLTFFTSSNFAVPTRAIRRISRTGNRSRYFSLRQKR